ncbi:unnamed protein product [Calypogeia fissa]
MTICCEFVALTTGALRLCPPLPSSSTAAPGASFLPVKVAHYGLFRVRRKCSRRGPAALSCKDRRRWFQDSENGFFDEVVGSTADSSSSAGQCFGFPSSSSKRCGPSVRAEAENSIWGADDHDHCSPLSPDNGVSLFDYSSLHIVGSPSQGDGASSPASSVVAGAASNNRAGLYRTPISGGVQSATSSHGLPHPAIAVRNLIEQARYAHLCSIMSRMHHRRRGYPFGSLVEFATDSSGHPILSLSPLAIHTRNLLADPRCTLVVQVPGWSGLANARVTLFGDVYPLPPERQEWAHKHYTVKHQHGASQQWGNFNYYRMELISDVYFVGGFGTVAWVDVNEYESALPDVIAAHGSEQTLQELNSRFSRPLKEVLSVESEVDDAALISIDSKGVDIRVRQGAQFNVQRLPFMEDHGVETLDQAIGALQKVLDDASKISH